MGPRAPLPLETTLTHSASLSLKYEVSLALRSASRLFCSRTRGCGGESRQLEDHPRAGIHFRQGEGHGRPFGGHLDLGTGSYVARGLGVLPAIAAENDWRLRRSSRRADSTTRCARSGSRTRTSGTRTGSCASGSTCSTSAAETAAAAKSHASDIALAHGSVPGGLDLTGLSRRLRCCR